MMNEKYDLPFTELLHTGIGITKNDKELTGNTVVRILNEQDQKITELEKEMTRLYNYFQDYLEDEMTGSSFSEMWDMVKESKYWE